MKMMITNSLSESSDQVWEFHQTFRSPDVSRGGVPQWSSNVALEQMRFSLITEEVGELIDAVEDDDLIEVVDALADIIYVIHGFFFSLDYAITDLRVPDPEPENVSAKAILEAYLEAVEKYIVNPEVTPEGLIYQLEILANLCWRYAYDKLGISLQDALNEVHRSNMTKLDENGNPVFREDGKIAKSALYEPPDLAKALNIPEGTSLSIWTASV